MPHWFMAHYEPPLRGGPVVYGPFNTPAAAAQVERRFMDAFIDRLEFTNEDVSVKVLTVQAPGLGHALVAAHWPSVPSWQ